VDPTDITGIDEVDDRFKSIQERIDDLFEELDELKAEIPKVKTDLSDFWTEELGMYEARVKNNSK